MCIASVPLSITMAVSPLLSDHPSLSMGLKPSKGGSDTLQSLGGGLGGLRPASWGASSIAEGAMAVKLEMEIGRGSGCYFISRTGDVACELV
jgi:hypothetical protein